MQFREKTVVVRLARGDVTKIAYVDEGSGDIPVIFVHGLGGGKTPFVELYAQTISEVTRFIALDRPGSGNSPKLVGTHSIARDAETILAFMDALKIERAVIYGMSLGAADAIELALHAPERVAGLVLQGPPINGCDLPVWLHGLWYWIRFKQMQFNLLPYRLGDATIREAKRLDIVPELSAFFMREDLMRIPRHVWPLIQQDFLQSDFVAAEEHIDSILKLRPERIRELVMPVLLVDGDSVSRKLVDTLPRLKAMLPHAETFIVSDAGHLASFIGAPGIARAIIRFLHSIS